jgi:WxL domain surface cell wall-binding
VALNEASALGAACGTAVPAGTSCTLTGTLNLTAGSLTLTSPGSLTWSSTLNGTNQSVVDTTAADQQYTVDDATGSGAGWHVTLSATTFTNGTHTLANTGTFVNTGSVTSISATTGPTATCATGATCTLPTNSTTYPVAVTTAATSPTPVTIYDTAASSGLGQLVVGGSTAANPVGWWLNVPGNAFAGAYTSTVTLAVISAP